MKKHLIEYYRTAASFKDFKREKYHIIDPINIRADGREKTLCGMPIPFAHEDEGFIYSYTSMQHNKERLKLVCKHCEKISAKYTN